LKSGTVRGITEWLDPSGRVRAAPFHAAAYNTVTNG